MVQWLSFSRMLTLFEPAFAAATSGRPSPLKSATSTSYGPELGGDALPVAYGDPGSVTNAAQAVPAAVSNAPAVSVAANPRLLIAFNALGTGSARQPTIVQ
jgi:hypothetical protein